MQRLVPTSMAVPGSLHIYPRLRLQHTPAPSNCLCVANPRPFPRPDLRSLSFSTQPLPVPVDMFLSLGNAGWWQGLSVHVSLHSANWLLHYPPRLRSSPSILADLPTGCGAPQGAKLLSSFTFPFPRGTGPILILSLFFFSFILPVYVGILLALS